MSFLNFKHVIFYSNDQKSKQLTSWKLNTSKSSHLINSLIITFAILDGIAFISRTITSFRDFIIMGILTRMLMMSILLIGSFFMEEGSIMNAKF